MKKHSGDAPEPRIRRPTGNAASWGAAQHQLIIKEGTYTGLPFP